MLQRIPPGPRDPLILLKKAADEDTSPPKVDVGVGVYGDEDGQYGPAHGDPEFLHLAAGIVLGEDTARKSRRVSQIHLALSML